MRAKELPRKLRQMAHDRVALCAYFCRFYYGYQVGALGGLLGACSSNGFARRCLSGSIRLPRLRLCCVCAAFKYADVRYLRLLFVIYFGASFASFLFNMDLSAAYFCVGMLYVGMDGFLDYWLFLFGLDKPEERIGRFVGGKVGTEIAACIDLLFFVVVVNDSSALMLGGNYKSFTDI